MFSKVLALWLLSFFAILVAATPGGHPPPPTTTTVTVTATPTATNISQCNTGVIKCCNHVGAADAFPQNLILGLFGVIIDPITAIVGLGCTSILGVGATCAQQPVCCENNTFNGLVNIGCVPITL